MIFEARGLNRYDCVGETIHTQSDGCLRIPSLARHSDIFGALNLRIILGRRSMIGLRDRDFCVGYQRFSSVRKGRKFHFMGLNFRVYCARKNLKITHSMLKLSFRSGVSFVLCLIWAMACKKDEPAPSVAQFYSPSISVLEFGGQQKIGINFSLPLQSDITLTINIADSASVYGTDYTTVPDGTSKTISIEVPKGSTDASFDLVPVKGTTVQGKRAVNFTLAGHFSNVQFGPTSSLHASLVDDGIVVQFVDEAITLKEVNGDKPVNITFSKRIQADDNLSIDILESTAVYGLDYTTIPDGSSHTINIPVAKDALSTSFTLIPLTDAGKIVNFGLKTLPQNCQFGQPAKLTATMFDDDLVLYLPMTGNAFDVSRVGNTTTVEGAALTTGRKSISNTAYQLDGISNDIVISNSTALDQLNFLTITAWIKPVSFYGIGSNAIVEKPYFSHSNPYYQYKLGITGDQRPNLPGSFLFSLSIGGYYEYVATNSNVWAPGNWYFVVGTYDGSKMVLYVNGTQVAYTPMSGNVDHYGNNVYIGQLKNLSAYTPGTFGDVRIYDRALTATEVSVLYAK